MHLRRGDRLRLQQEAGANLHFAADPEGIDALIARRCDGSGADDLPVIIFSAVVD